MVAVAPLSFFEHAWTFERAAALDPDESPGEIVDGAFVPVSRSTWCHGAIVATIVVLLKLYARRQPGWSVATGDPGTKLRRSPDSLRGPDIGVVRKERVPTGKGEAGWLQGAPDLAVEVAGDSQTVQDLKDKGQEYLDAGARMVWVVDPGAARVVVMTPPDQQRELGAGELLDGGDVLPGFSCQVAELFET